MKMNVLLTSTENLDFPTISYTQASRHFDNNQAAKKLEEAINAPVAVTEENAHHDIHPFIYGFIVFLVFCILVSFGKALYYYCKIEVESTSETAENNTNADRPTMLRRRLDNTDMSDSDRLRSELDKLRISCYERKAMNTDNADSTVDISMPSTSYVDNSRSSSADYDTLWSSIDFDDFEQSSIYENILRKTSSEGCMSSLLSEVSLNFPEILFQNIYKKSVSSSEEYCQRTTSSENRLPKPSSKAIAEIIALLDAFVPRNTTIELSSKKPSALKGTKASSLSKSSYPRMMSSPTSESDDPGTSFPASESSDLGTSSPVSESGDPGTSCPASESCDWGTSSPYSESDDPMTTSFASESVDPTTTSFVFEPGKQRKSCYSSEPGDLKISSFASESRALSSVSESGNPRTSCSASELGHFRTPSSINSEDSRTSLFSGCMDTESSSLLIRMHPSKSCYSEPVTPVSPIPLKAQPLRQEINWNTPLNHEVIHWRTPTFHKIDTRRKEPSLDMKWATCAPPLSSNYSRETLISDTVLSEIQGSKSADMRILSSEILSSRIQFSSESLIQRNPIIFTRLSSPDEMKWSTPLSYKAIALTPLIHETGTQSFLNESTWLTPPPPSEAISKNSSDKVNEAKDLA